MDNLIKKKKIGLIVNPFAGIGGRVGLKGSDGLETVKKAIELGAVSPAPERAIITLKKISILQKKIKLYTYPCEMGEDEAKDSGFINPVVIGTIVKGETTPEDTKKAALKMAKRGVELLLFVGGDGTARDIYDAIDSEVPVLGIPAGVKIHSSVFAITPQHAGDLVEKYIKKDLPLRATEVMDIDENLFRKGKISAQLYGYMNVPFERKLIQGAKSRSSFSTNKIREIAQFIVDNMSEEYYYILSTGTTVKAIGDILRIDKTLLGVDLVYKKKLIGKDLNEKKLLKFIVDKRAKIIVTVIGGQGYIFGRGNQQISPQIIRMVGKKNLIVIATQDKLISLDRPLLVDTGESGCDKYLSGYMRVITGYNEESICKVEC